MADVDYKIDDNAAEDNLDLFPHIELSLEELNQILTVDKKSAWESTLFNALDLTALYFKQAGFEQQDVDKHTIGVVRVMSHLVNGQPLYFPGNKRLDAAIRNHAIYIDFIARVPLPKMMEKYNLTKAALYNIYNQQKQLPMNQIKPLPQLFAPE